MTKFAEFFEQLIAEFDPSQIRTRIVGGEEVSYITTRTVMNRLDKVAGPEGWEDRYVETDRAVICKLRVRLPDGIWTQKCGNGSFALVDPPAPEPVEWNRLPWQDREQERSKRLRKRVEAFKLAAEATYAEAFKRAAVKFGVGRYLYNEGLPAFLPEHEQPLVMPVGRKGTTGPGRPMNPQQLHDHLVKTPGPLAPSQHNSINPKQFAENPKAGTSGVWTWITEVGKYYHFDVLRLLNYVTREKGLSPDVSLWGQQDVTRFCEWMRKKARGTAVYQGEFESTPLLDQANSSPDIDNAIVKAQGAVMAWATHLASHRLPAGAPITDADVAKVIYEHSDADHPMNGVSTCTDINVLDRILANIRNSAQQFM